MPVHSYGERPISNQLVSTLNHRGLGLRLAEASRHGGFADDQFFEALGNVTVSPSKPLGIHFTREVTVFDPRPIDECVKYVLTMRRRDGIEPLAPRTRRHFAFALEHAVPLILPPYDDRAYADLTNAIEFDLHLQQHPEDIWLLPGTPRADLIRPNPIALDCPLVGGQISRRILRGFFVNFPGFAELVARHLDAVYGGRDWHHAAAGDINEIIGDLLGIVIDARVGSIIPAADMEFAMSLAHLPHAEASRAIVRIDAGMRLMDPRLHGSYWSLMVDDYIERVSGEEIQADHDLHAAIGLTTVH